MVDLDNVKRCERVKNYGWLYFILMVLWLEGSGYKLLNLENKLFINSGNFEISILIVGYKLLFYVLS